MNKIGFIGLGNMGFYMAKNLLNANFEVIGYDINDRVFEKFNKIDEKFKKTSSIENLCNESDIIITMLPNGNIVKKICSEVIQYISSKSIFVDCSTIDIETSKYLHEEFKKRNILSLDAPVSGGTIGAKNGSLTFMIGGKLEAFKKMKKIFEVMGNRQIYCGVGGNGQATKMCNNLLLAITMTGLGESLNLARNLNLNLDTLFEVLSTSTGSCWAVNNYFPVKGIGPESPADNKFKPGFSSNLMLKDLTLAVDASQSLDINLKFGNIVLGKYKIMKDNNKGELDFSAIINENN